MEKYDLFSKNVFKATFQEHSSFAKAGKEHLYLQHRSETPTCCSV